jgi:isopenicillin-N N-acyltransferase like protein
MQSRPRHWIATGIMLALMLSVARQTWSQDQKQPPKPVTVSKTYNNSPFDYSIRLLSERPQFCVYRLTYPSPVVTPVKQNNTVPADYYLPNGIKPGDPKRPAVICLHILDGNEPLTDLVCSVLAGRGIPAISFKLPYYGPRGTAKGPEGLADNPQLFVGAIAQAGEDIRRTIDLLASREEVNPERIGITGISLGAIIAATAAGAEPRLNRAGLILGGGDLLKIIHHARETQTLSAMLKKLPQAEREEVEGKITERDPLQFAAGLRERARDGRVLMLNAAADEVVPRACTEKLAEAIGISDRVVWFEGLGHYTAMAELPRAMRMMADFFAKDLPPGVEQSAGAASSRLTPLQRFAAVLQQGLAILTTEPQDGRCHYAALELTLEGRRPIEARLRYVRGTHGKFLLQGKLPEVGEVAMGQGRFPWLAAGAKKVVAGTKDPAENRDPLQFVNTEAMTRLRVAGGAVGAFVMVPEMLQQWIAAEEDKTANGNRSISIVSKDPRKMPGRIRLKFEDDGHTPVEAVFTVGGMRGTLRFRGWQVNAVANDAMFEPSEENRQEVDQADIHHIFGAALNFAIDRLDRRGGPTADLRSTAIKVIGRDPAGHGRLCRCQGKTILMVSGTPAQMGAAQGRLLGDSMQILTERVLYLVGGGDTLNSGTWFLDRMADIERRTLPHIPPRFIVECDALAKAAGISQRDGRYANLFPERFHCSGVALMGKATVGGRVLHARVLDYMSEIGLQDAAVVQVFMPEGRNKWMSLGYAGFIGTVTAMNERGLAIGEMGGRGEGQWDGTPMTMLLRDAMERAGTVEEALAILREAPRTCEYYYVLSDRSGTIRAVECTPQKMTVMKPGQQDPRLPHVPDDSVFISGGDRAVTLARRIEENYGRIDARKLIEIIKRPVAMQSNLHDAVFAPETLEMWFADAGRFTSACDEPYAHVNLRELIEFYARPIEDNRPADGDAGRP